MDMTSTDCFSRNSGTLNEKEQRLLADATVAVIGCGGLGGYVIEHLARIGIGRIHAVDPDVFSVSNCNRQLNALTETLGQGKAEVAARRVAAIHPFCTVTAFPADFRNAQTSLDAAVVIDCLDDTTARRDLATICTAKSLPLVHGSVMGWCGQVGVQLPGGTLYARLYPHRTDKPAAPPSVLSVTVGLVASLQVAEAVKLLLDIPSDLQKGWIYMDLESGDFMTMGTETAT